MANKKVQLVLEFDSQDDLECWTAAYFDGGGEDTCEFDAENFGKYIRARDKGKNVVLEMKHISGDDYETRQLKEQEDFNMRMKKAREGG